MNRVEDPAEITQELLSLYQRTAERVVEHFLDEMPEAYFLDTNPATRAMHLSAILGAKASGVPLALTLKSPDTRTWTFIHEGDAPGLLARLLEELPRDRRLRSAKVHSASDGSLVLDVFRFEAEAPSEPEPQRIDELLATVGSELRPFLEACDAEYLRAVSPDRLRAHHRLLHNLPLCGRAEAEADAGPASSRLSLAVRSTDPGRLFHRVVRHATRRGLNIRRAYLDRFASHSWSRECIVTLIVERGDGSEDELLAELIRLEWVDRLTLQLLDDSPTLGLTQAEVLIACCNLAHAALSPADPYGFARERLHGIVRQHSEIANRVVELLLGRFDPAARWTRESVEEERDRLTALIREEADDKYARGLLEKLLEIATGVLRTNLWRRERIALTLRVDGGLLEEGAEGERPFGVFFVHGRDFDAFHVRFRDIARGGVRLVLPRTMEQHFVEAERHYAEARGLAQAQQLKNKDIPEGGSKAVVLTRPDTPAGRAFRAFVDALLDLACPPGPEEVALVDYWGQPETLYLGPDENVSAELIDWLVERARERGYAMPEALMSSKPLNGINHKEYGVTSEGVTVFLAEALRAVGLDPAREPFTVKLTGGPDGDVAGNEIKILHRDFPHTARIVCISDGTGFAVDPEGLRMEALLRLVDRGVGITSYPEDALSNGGRLVAATDRRSIRERNGIHNVVVADAFIPAGGRPESLHRYNWQAHLDATGAPTSRVIVEGANLFLTPDARRELSQRGVKIVKDSSANKTGVICSSFEILASMIVTPEEFVELKAPFIADVVARLQKLARAEAQLLFREHARQPQQDLPTLSVDLSRHLISLADAIQDVYVKLPEADKQGVLARVVEMHVPKALRAAAGATLLERLPESYRTSLVSTVIARRIVYAEGLAYLGDDVPGRGQAALKYFDLERDAVRLMDTVREAQLQDEAAIIALLRRGIPNAAVE